MSIKMHAIQLSTTYKFRILGVLVVGLLCFLNGAECKRSACWRYGHVCWGGHGKRSGQPPLLPLSGSSEAVDGSDLRSPQWIHRETDTTWRMNPKQAFTIPLYGKAPKVIRQPIGFMENYNGRPKVSQMVMIKSVNQQPGMITRTINGDLEGNEARQAATQMESDYLNSIADDSFVVPDSSMLTKSSHENRPVSHGSLAGVLKRSAPEDVLGNVNSGGGTGTEEPLVTSANGLDSDGVVTFFRDRKSIGKQINSNDPSRNRHSANLHGGAKEEGIRFPKQEQFDNIYDIMMSQYRPTKNMPSDAKVYF